VWKKISCGNARGNKYHHTRVDVSNTHINGYGKAQILPSTMNCHYRAATWIRGLVRTRNLVALC